MRRLVSRLAWWGFAAILATGAVIAGLMLLIAWRTEPTPVRPLTVPEIATTRPEALSLPDRLGPARQPRSLVDATFDKIEKDRPAATGSLEAQLEGASDGLTVSLTSVASGATPASIAAGGPLVRLANVPAGSYWVSAAPAGASPRFGYVARAGVEVVGGAEAKVVLRCGRSEIRFQLPAGARAADLTLARDDDPRWLLGSLANGGQALASGEQGARLPGAAAAGSRPTSSTDTAPLAVVSGLGPGRYTASLRGKSAAFEVPPARTVDLR